MELEGQDADCPQINLLVILLSIQKLRGKIQRSPTESTPELPLLIHSPPEITKLYVTLKLKSTYMHQHNVLRFDVPVKNLLIMNVTYGI